MARSVEQVVLAEALCPRSKPAPQLCLQVHAQPRQELQGSHLQGESPTAEGATQLLAPQNVSQEWGMPSHRAHRGPNCLQRTEATTLWEASAVTKERDSTIPQP